MRKFLSSSGLLSYLGPNFESSLPKVYNLRYKLNSLALRLILGCMSSPMTQRPLSAGFFLALSTSLTACGVKFQAVHDLSMSGACLQLSSSQAFLNPLRFLPNAVLA